MHAKVNQSILINAFLILRCMLHPYGQEQNVYKNI